MMDETTVTIDDMRVMYKYITDDVVTEPRTVTEEDMERVRVWFASVTDSKRDQ